MSGSTSSVLAILRVGAISIGNINKSTIFIRCREKMRLKMINHGLAVPAGLMAAAEVACSADVASILNTVPSRQARWKRTREMG